MSMSINSAATAFAVRMAEPSSKGTASIRKDAEGNMPQIQNDSEPPRSKSAEEIGLRRQRQLEKMADRLAVQIEANGTRREELASRWKEQFVNLEAKARDQGNDRLAERIAEIGVKVTEQLEDASERIASHLEQISEQTDRMLSTSYGTIGDGVERVRPNPGIDEVA